MAAFLMPLATHMIAAHAAKKAAQLSSARNEGGNIMDNSTIPQNGPVATPGSALPSFEEGTDYVSQTGPAFLHQGEAIIPADENPHFGKGDASLEARPADENPHFGKGDASLEARPVDVESHIDRLDKQADTAAKDNDLATLASLSYQKNLMDSHFGKGNASLEARPADQPPEVHAPGQSPDMATVGTAPVFGAPSAARYTGPGKVVLPGQPIPARQLPQDEYQYRNNQVDQAIDQAMRAGDMETADRLRLMKMEESKGWGNPENHPGKLGKIAHVLSRIGNVAGDVLAPKRMANIPGSDIYKRNEEERLKGDIDKESAAAAKDAPKVMTPEQVAAQNHEAARQQVGNIMSTTEAQRTPEQKKQLERIQASYPDLIPPTRAVADAPVGDSGVTRHGQGLALMSQGMEPAQREAFKNAYAIQPTDTEASAAKRLEDARVTAQMSGAERDRKIARDTAHTNHEDAQRQIESMNDRRDKSEEIKARQEIAKIYATSVVSAERYNIMTKNLSDALPAYMGGHNDQQAMLSLLANHLGMTMGLQKGARLNQAIIDEAAKSQPWLSKIGAKFDKDLYLTGLTLGPEQMKSMVNLARERYKEDIGSARSTAEYAGATDDGPKRSPSESTMHYYLDLSGGDVNKARQLAAEDGWSEASKGKK